MTRKTSIILAAGLLALLLAGCSTLGSGVQGVGRVFNKTGGAIKNLG